MKVNGGTVVVTNVLLLLLMEYFEVVTSSSYLTCYSCVYDPTLSERVLVRRSMLLRHRTTLPLSYTIQSERNNSVTSSLIARRHNERYVINTESCNMPQSRGAQTMPSRICPKIPGYFEFCNREYVFSGSRLLYVSRDCQYMSRNGRTLPADDLPDTFTKQTRACTSFLCNDDIDTLIGPPALDSNSDVHDHSDVINNRSENSEHDKLVLKPSEGARTLGSVFSRGKRLNSNQTSTPGTPADQLDIADDTNTESKPGRGNGTRNRGDDMEQIDEDAENDDEDNYYNADGSGINIELSRYFPTSEPLSSGVKLGHLSYLILGCFIGSFL